MMYKIRLSGLLLIAAPGVLAITISLTSPARGETTLLNVSYDPTRELYQDYNKAFAAHWKEATGQEVSINQSHGGSSAQARAVIDGLEADVVTLGIPPDVTAIAKAGLIATDWQSRLPDNSAPYTSTVVFLVRKGNPKQVKDWGDLVRPGIAIITPNPKTSGVARLNYLAAWGYALKRWNGDEAKARAFVASLYRNVPVLDSGGRGATLTFVQRGIGDVLLAWENEAIMAVTELGKDEYELVIPSMSILAEPSVAVVDKVVERHGTGALAEAYLRYLYSPAGQEIIAMHHYRPRDAAVAAKYVRDFPEVDRMSVDSLGGWDAVQQHHFADGGLFDQLIGEAKR